MQHAVSVSWVALEGFAVYGLERCMLVENIARVMPVTDSIRE